MNTPYPTSAAWPRAVLFDLLTALLDSWTVWNAAAGSEAAGRDWRAEYLRLTYGCGAYQPYEDLVRTAARNRGLPEAVADRLEAQWEQLQPWDGARELLAALRPHCRLAVVTNCSERLGQRAAALLGVFLLFGHVHAAWQGALLLLPLVAMRPMVAPLLLVLPLFLTSYLVQKRRYAAIVEALRMQLRADFPR